MIFYWYQISEITYVEYQYTCLSIIYDIYLYNINYMINYDYTLLIKYYGFKFISEPQYHYDLYSFNCSTRLSVNSTSAFIICMYGLLVDILLFIMTDAL